MKVKTCISPPHPAGEAGAAAAEVTRALVATLTALVTQIRTLDTHIANLLREHADAHSFLSLRRAQALRAARLLAEIGDCRARFPTPEFLASLAGVTPSTRQSGKMKTTSFRWSADKQLRDTACDLAADSRHANPCDPPRPRERVHALDQPADVSRVMITQVHRSGFR